MPFLGRLFSNEAAAPCGHRHADERGVSTAIVRRATSAAAAADGAAIVRIRSAKPKLIAVDPDPHVLNFIAAVAEPWYHVIAARDSCWAKAWLLQYHDVGAIVATQSLSCGEGVDLLERCGAVRPDVLRVLVTPRTDARRPVQAVMRGIAQRLVEWPMSEENLRAAIDPARLGIEVTPHALVA